MSFAVTKSFTSSTGLTWTKTVRRKGLTQYFIITSQRENLALNGENSFLCH